MEQNTYIGANVQRKDAFDKVSGTIKFNIDYSDPGLLHVRMLKFEKGEFLVQIAVGKEYCELPYRHVKKTRSGELDYPLISLSAVKKDGSIRVAFGGITPYPFRSAQIEDDLNNSALESAVKIPLAMSRIPGEKINDLLGSSEYREFLLSNTLKDILVSLEEAQ